jgi:hypothetical protein
MSGADMPATLLVAAAYIHMAKLLERMEAERITKP